MDEALRIHNDGRMAGPGSGAVIRPQPDPKIAAAAIVDRNGLTESGLAVGPARTGVATGKQGLLNQSGAIHARPRPASQPIARAQEAFGGRRQVWIEAVKISQVLGLHLIHLGHQGIERDLGLRRRHPGNRERRQRLQQIQVDMAHRPIPAGPAPAATIRLLQQVKGLAEQDLTDRIAALIGNRGKADPTPPGPGRAVAGCGHQALQGLFGQVRPGQKTTGIRVDQISHAAG